MNENLTIKEKGTVGKRVATNTGLMVGAKALSAVIGLVSLFLAARALDVADFGIILFLHAYMLFFAEVATFQSWQAVIRFGTHDVEKKDTASLGRLLRFCIALDFTGAVVAFVLSIVGLLLFGKMLPLLSVFHDPAALENVGKIVSYGMPYCLLILIHQEGASTGIFRLFDKFKPLAVQALVMPVFRLVGVFIALYFDLGVVGFLAAWFLGSFMRYLALPLMALRELKKRNLLRTVFSEIPFLKIKRAGVWPFVWKANIDASLGTGTTHLPVLLVMPIFGPAFVSVYKIADEIAKLLSEGVLLLDRVIYPEYARMMSRGQGAGIGRIVVKAAVILLAGGLALSAVVAIFGPWVIPRVFGQGYDDAVMLSILLVLAAALMGAAAPLYPVFYAAGKPGYAIFARGAGLACYIALIFVLSVCLGEMGPGWAAIGGNIVAVILAAYLAKRTLQTHGR
ncbi:MAG: hypothetical protein COA43_06625 [Robiginitomaculum sp.]|nr:MAG: hypothetical protein COA43_06625 [Robiginitomaculum sp.]